MASVPAELAIGRGVPGVNVAIVCPYDLGSNGGVQDQAVRMVGWLRELGNTVTLIGPGTQGPPDHPLPDGTVLLGPTRVITANRSSTPIMLDPRVGTTLRGVMADTDVVHIHEPLMPAVSVLATRIGDVPKVGTFHADPPTWVRRTYRGTGMVLRRVLSRIDVATATSPVSRSAIARFIDARIVPNGVEIAAYRPGTKRAGSVAFLGRDDPRKGLDVLLTAWPAVLEAVPRAHLTVMGASRDLSVPGVTYLGRVSEQEKADVLSTTEIYCAPNLGGESFGIVLVEAMASGCAVLASGIPAFAHVVSDAGALVAPQDPVGLASRIVSLLVDDTRREELQSAALVRAAEFEGRTVATLFEQAYHDAIAHHGRPR